MNTNTTNIIEELNVKHEENYNESIEVVKRIINNTEGCPCCSNELNKYFNYVAKFIIKIVELEKELNDSYFETKTFDELLAINHNLYEDVIDDNYEKSYANPKLMVEQYGKELGQILAYLYTKVRGIIMHAYEHNHYSIMTAIEMFIDLYSLVMNADEDFDTNILKKEININIIKNAEEKRRISIFRRFDPEFKVYSNILINSNYDDIRYLFKYGVYISDNEIKSARYITSLSEDKVKLIADVYTEAFEKGYISDNKDMSYKKSVNLAYQIGFERIMKVAVNNFAKKNLKPIVYITDPLTSSRLYHTKPNKQMIYDHRFDEALYFNKDYTDKVEKVNSKILAENSELLEVFAGPAVMEVFGEKPFSPISKEECIKLNKEQTELKNQHTSIMGKELNKHLPRSKYSFVIVAYPLPEIGDNYEELFDEIVKVNTLDSDLYEKIQQTIIDVLDKADYIHVKGKDNNKTDIKVKMHKLENPNKQSNFENCVATVNVPVGEMFTSPVLEGTNGVLHVSEVYLRELKYEDLEITFKDGMIKDYTCTNFDTENENKKYIHENLIHPHDTLPIGEFAIGTNTTAYVMANKYDIVKILPILIVEKMGPHFAIGDTCYSWSEDVPVYNPDGKEMIARDNEVSILRHSDVSKAYTYKHTDITIPYNEIEFIAVVTEDGESIDIIREGRFVLEGTEELNKPFNN